MRTKLVITDESQDNELVKSLAAACDRWETQPVGSRAGYAFVGDVKAKRDTDGIVIEFWELLLHVPTRFKEANIGLVYMEDSFASFTIDPGIYRRRRATAVVTQWTERRDGQPPTIKTKVEVRGKNHAAALRLFTDIRAGQATPTKAWTPDGQAALV